MKHGILSAPTAAPAPSFNRWPHVLQELHAPWIKCALGFAALTLFCWVASFIDERTFNGVSVWTKPFKFSLSLGVYFLTLAWFSPLLRAGFFRTRQGRCMTAVPIVFAVFEIAYIAIQAAQGEASHFNKSTPFYDAMYGLMGLGAVSLVSVCLWMAFGIARNRSVGEPYVLAVIVGLVGTFVIGGGFGGYLSSAGSHWVGGAQTDAGGLPLVHWSTSGGDLRVAHFIGMHAMQIIPLVGALAARLISTSRATFTVIVFSILYAALATATFIQAVGGSPLVTL